jgi:glutathione-regulated potassium-efflux system ancillary protein KefG
VRQLLAPVEQTARLCRMTFLPPFLVHGTHRMPDEEVATAAARYAALLAALADDRFPALSQAALDAHDTIAPLLDAVPGVGAAAGAPLAGARA